MNYSLLQKLVDESKLNKATIAGMARIARTTLDNALSGADIRITTLENLSKVLGVKTSIFFEEQNGHTATSSGDSSIAEINSEVTVNGKEESEVMKEKVAYLEALLAEKERTIQILMNNNSK